jgi:type IV pilus assembly protein PilE
MMRPLRVPRAAGFTLIELMITVAIVAILGTIAMASYTKQVQKSRRTDARSAVMDLAGREEKLFSTLNAYSATPSELGYTVAPDTFPFNMSDTYYSLNVTIGAPPNTFLITATAIGAQAKDTDCASLSIDQLGTQSATGANAASCWGN